MQLNCTEAQEHLWQYSSLLRLREDSTASVCTQTKPAHISCNMLRMVKKQIARWQLAVCQVPAAEFAVNNSVNESTGETPAFLMQGQHPLTPVTIQTDSDVLAARLFASQLQQTIIKVQRNLRKAQKRQKAYANIHRRDVTYSVGDKVLLSTRNLTFRAQGTREFLPKFIGPFLVQAIVNKVAVRLQLPHTCRIHPVFHVSLQRPYNVSEYTAMPLPPLEVDAEGIPVYEVEDVLALKPLKQGRRLAVLD